MLFRRARIQKVTFEDLVNQAHDYGFKVTPQSAGRVRVARNGITAVVEETREKPLVVEAPGITMGTEVAVLVDGGFQKFFQTPSGKRKPAQAADLKAVHDFQEDLRAAFGLTSLYNEALGSVSRVYLYDRVKGRDSAGAKKPWELQVRGEDPVEKI